MTNVVADHVTLARRRNRRHAAAAQARRADRRPRRRWRQPRMPGGRDRRRRPTGPDGSTYHITWSLGPGRKARESNDVLRDQGWEPSAGADPGRARAGALLMAEPRLFLDADGVLADFDRGRASAARHATRQNSSPSTAAAAFWKRLATGEELLRRRCRRCRTRGCCSTRSKHLKPTILTGLPLGSWAAPQKVEWAAEHFPGVPIITCMARDKHKHMQPGDVLVDDRENHRAAYEAAGVRLRASQECRGQPQAAGEDLSVGEGAVTVIARSGCDEATVSCWMASLCSQ